MIAVYIHPQDFVYPEDVALPLGGVGNSEYIVIEMHYDNPRLVPGQDVII